MLLTCVLLVIALVVMNLLDVNPIARDDTSQIAPTTAVVTEAASDNIVTETAGEAASDSAQEGDSYIPDLVGKSYEIKKQQLEADGWLYLEAIYEYSDEYKAGLIIAQSRKAGDPFVSGSTIEVTVSKGPSSIKLPEYQGKTLKEYEAELQELGLTNYNTESVVNYDYKNNEVIELSKEAGEKFDLTGAETLKIYYASNPESTSAPEQHYEPEPATNPPAPLPEDNSSSGEEGGDVATEENPPAPEPENNGSEGGDDNAGDAGSNDGGSSNEDAAAAEE